jgi:hypothetical protein
VKALTEKARAAGLIQPQYRGMSAKQLRKANPDLAARWAKFLEENKDEFVRGVADALERGS